jgi:RNA polymerase sigma-70 factor (ECF subfamily)
VYRALVLIVKDPQDALDLAQETFLRFHATLSGFRAEAGIRSWLLKIATNLALNRLRDRETGGTHRRHLSTDALPEDVSLASPPESDPQEIAIRRLETEEVGAFLQSLSAPLRAVAVLRFFENLAYEEISRVLDLNVGTVRSRLNAVRWHVRAVFERR